MTRDEIKARAEAHGQHHLLRHADAIAESDCDRLYEAVGSLDFEQIAQLHADAGAVAAEIDPSLIAPSEVIELPRTEADRERWKQAEELGRRALAAGQAAVVLVAGGQGSRLGFEHPKGMFPIGPVRQTSLFQIFAEKILARGRQAGTVAPWYIMTSPENRAETEAYFATHAFFGLEKANVTFFEQGTMPAVDKATGKILLADKHAVFASPNGHGGTLLALRKSAVLEDMKRRGCEYVYYFQVDNPFVEVLEPAFLGHHIAAGSEFSAKVVRKVDPKEKVGLIVRYDRRPTVIEYSDLPDELGGMRASDAADAGLKYWPGSIAIHVFSVPFLERVAEQGLPFHIAHKAVPCLDETGELTQPKSPNAIKFETFIFDAMPMANKVAVVETDRDEEFQPVKNADGVDSPASVRAALGKRAGQWLNAAGIEFAADAAGAPVVPVEISPLAGLSADDFAAGGWAEKRIDKPTYFTKEG